MIVDSKGSDLLTQIKIGNKLIISRFASFGVYIFRQEWPYWVNSVKLSFETIPSQARGGTDTLEGVETRRGDPTITRPRAPNAY